MSATGKYIPTPGLNLDRVIPKTLSMVTAATKGNMPSSKADRSSRKEESLWTTEMRRSRTVIDRQIRQAGKSRMHIARQYSGI